MGLEEHLLFKQVVGWVGRQAGEWSLNSESLKSVNVLPYTAVGTWPIDQVKDLKMARCSWIVYMAPV